MLLSFILCFCNFTLQVGWTRNGQEIRCEDEEMAEAGLDMDFGSSMDMGKEEYSEDGKEVL